MILLIYIFSKIDKDLTNCGTVFCPNVVFEGIIKSSIDCHYSFCWQFCSLRLGRGLSGHWSRRPLIMSPLNCFNILKSSSCCGLTDGTLSSVAGQVGASEGPVRLLWKIDNFITKNLRNITKIWCCEGIWLCKENGCHQRSSWSRLVRAVKCSNKWSQTTGGGIVMSNVTESIKMGSNDTAWIKIILKWHFLLSLCDWGSWRKFYQWWLAGFSKNINLGQGRVLLMG